MSHKTRFEHLGELSDIEKAIEYDNRAVSATRDGDPVLSERLSNLGTSHRYRFDRLGELKDLEKAIECQSHGLAIASDSNHPYLATVLSSLGISYNTRYQRLGGLDDLEKAIEYESQALALTPDGHPDRPSRLANIGLSHSDRFKRLGGLTSLEKAIEYQSQALALTPGDHPDIRKRLVNLAGPHRYRFQYLGELDDLDKAIEYQYRALELVPNGHPHFPAHLANLGGSHSDRYQYLSELNDLEKAIEYESRALALTPDGHPNMPERLANLGISHSDRFVRLNEFDDLEKAIEYQSRALTLTPDGHSYLPSRLTSLGKSHTDRFHRVRNLDDLEKSMEYESRALKLTPDNHPDILNRLASLGGSHNLRYQLLGDLDDLQQAIEYGKRVLAAASNENPISCRWYFNHAICYNQYYHQSNNPSHLQQALLYFRKASMSPAGAPKDRFKIAHNWASVASRVSGLDPIGAYQTAIDLLPHFIWLGATTDQRYEDLTAASTLAVDAANAAIFASDYYLALEWLEHARCMVWNQNLALRSPLDLVEASHPLIATRLNAIAHELHRTSLSSRDAQVLSSSPMPIEAVGQRRRQLATEYNQLLDQVHELPGFEEFLRPIKSDRLMLAARNGPIVVINCHRDQCDALIVRPEQTSVMHIPLPNFSGHKALTARLELRMSVDSSRAGERGSERRPMSVVDQRSEFGSVLAILWYDVVKPVLDHLGYMKNDAPDNLPHITWCPTGAMTFLPLHAAGDYDQPRSRVFDYVISSYTPTLTALLESAPHSHNGDCRVLAVGQANTPGHAPLPGTTMELDHVKTQVQGKANYTQLIDAQANVATVLDEMERHDWVHLACHAHQNVTDAKQSGFFLHGGVLDLDAINRRSFKGKGLAFLSACQTATGDEKLPDEAVHLASGMLMAGYTSVIATMWSVHDEDAPFVADEVYGQLMNEGKLGNGEAGKALHHAVAGLRDRVGDNEYSRWVPYIHIGS